LKLRNGSIESINTYLILYKKLQEVL